MREMSRHRRAQTGQHGLGEDQAIVERNDERYLHVRLLGLAVVVLEISRQAGVGLAG